MGILPIDRAALFLALMCCAALSACAQPKWVYQQKIKFDRWEDQAGVVLTDNRALQIDSQRGPNDLTFDEILAWKSGRPLELVFSKGTGPRLLDPMTGRSVAILGGFNDKLPHPLDALTSQCFADASNITTQDLMGCYGIARWRAEIQRLLSVLQEQLPETQMQLVRESQTAWEQFEQAQMNLLNEVDTDGSLSRVNRAAEITGMNRDRVFQLMYLVKVSPRP